MATIIERKEKKSRNVSKKKLLNQNTEHDTFGYLNARIRNQ